MNLNGRIKTGAAAAAVMLVLGLQSAPAAAQAKDPFAALEAIGPEVLLRGVIREDDIDLLFRHIRESIAASMRGEEARQSEAMVRRQQEIQREVAARGAVLAGVLLTAFESAAKQAMREAIDELNGRESTRRALQHTPRHAPDPTYPRAQPHD